MEQEPQERALAELLRLTKDTNISFTTTGFHSSITWEENQKHQHFPTSASMNDLLKEARKRLGYTPDVILCALNRKNFKGLYWGVHMGYRPEGVQMLFVKDSSRMEDTIGHEIAHTFNDIAGVKIAELFNVKDYDADVVHRQSNKNKWREIFLKVNPFLEHKSDIVSLIKQTITLIKKLIELKSNYTIPMNKSEQLYEKAISMLGKDASPRDLVNDSVGCAETVSSLINSIDPTFNVITGTWTLWDMFKLRGDFALVNPPEKGCIVLSVTGLGNGKVPNGHAGIVGEDGIIMSNDSRTGKFLENYTIDEWVDYFQKKGGYPVFYFKWLKQN